LVAVTGGVIVRRRSGPMTTSKQSNNQHGLLSHRAAERMAPKY